MPYFDIFSITSFILFTVYFQWCYTPDEKNAASTILFYCFFFSSTAQFELEWIDSTKQRTFNPLLFFTNHPLIMP